MEGCAGLGVETVGAGTWEDTMGRAVETETYRFIGRLYEWACGLL